MNTLIKRIAKSAAMPVALCASAFFFSPATAVAQTHVTVDNAPSAPVPVTGTVNSYPAAQVLYPYQQQGSIGDSSTCAPQCIITFPVVPAGRRLVLTAVSSQLGANNSIFVIEGNNIAYFVQKPYQAASYLSEPITLYFEPGSTPTARFFVQDATQHTSLIVTFVGYYVPVPQP